MVRSLAAPLRRLCDQWREVEDLRQTLGLLEWDQETLMPAGGHEGRARALGTLAALTHRATTAPVLREVLAAASEASEAGGVEAAQVAAARRVVERAVRVPESLARTLAEAKSRAFAAWQQAREDADFGAFAPHLAILLDLKRQEAAAIDANRPVYDVLLDDFEPGATEQALVPLFARLREALVPLTRAVLARGRTVDESIARGRFDGADQIRFGQRMAEAFGFDFTAGRIDLSAHPFCIGINPRDVRLTCRFEDHDFRACLFGILHETGHGLFEQGIPECLRYTPLAEVHSLGVHESQSRLWENHVGRSLGFWRWAAPEFQRAFPAFKASAEILWPALHTVRPSLIRVEADEATYNLHIAIRFEIERALLRGDLEIADLPVTWNDAYQQLLGIRPANDAEGVLQDVHWSHAIFGYFPTYTLGTMAAAQLFVAAEHALGDLESSFARGVFAPLLAWLRANVHCHGGRFGVAALMAEVTGAPLSPDALLAYLEHTAEAVYGV